MLEKRGISFYAQTLRGVIVFLVFVVALGFTTPVSAAGAGFCKSHPISPHCHIGHHGETEDFLWDLIVEIIDADGNILLSVDDILVSHADVTTLDPEKLCNDAAGEFLDYASSGLFIDVHRGLNHNHDDFGFVKSDGENRFDEDHYHILTATCTLGAPGDGGGNGGGNGKGRNK